MPKKPKKIKDTDYLVISARVKVMETRLLSQEQMEQVLIAHTNEDAVKILRECGYPELDPSHPEKMDAALAAFRQETQADLAAGMPDIRYLDVFKIKYDYHNIKAVLKAQAVETQPDRMLMDMGRVPAADIKAALQEREPEKLPGMLAEAAEEAQKVLETTRDPQLSDLVLDRWYYKDLAAVAEATGSAFLAGYVRIQIDAANLRILVRTLRMGKSADFLESALFENGSVSAQQLVRIMEKQGSGLKELYHSTGLSAAAEAGADALTGGSLTEFEKRCDDAVGDYLASAKFVPFGEAPLLGYLAARETEYTNLRIILLGRKAGLAPEVIRTRLRASYV